MQIDLIDMRHMPDDSYNYIAHYMNYWSKFHVMWPLMRKSAVEVAVGLATKVLVFGASRPRYCSLIMAGNLSMKLSKKH